MTRHVPMNDVPQNERPRERLMRLGAGALSSAELLAIIMGTGSHRENVLHLAERVISEQGGLNKLAQAQPADLVQIAGIGPAKVAQILAAIELGRRMLAVSSDDVVTVFTAADAAHLVMDMGHLRQEQIRLILLSHAHHVIATPTVYVGTVNTAVVRVSEIFKEAITRNAPALILVHNHPSGDASPSPEDVQLTERLIEAGKLLDIAVLDHLIIAGSAWRSLKDMRLGFG